MFAVIGTVDNYTILPSPVLDDSDPKGYRIEQRLQVTLKLAANASSTPSSSASAMSHKRRPPTS